MSANLAYSHYTVQEGSPPPIVNEGLILWHGPVESVVALPRVGIQIARRSLLGTRTTRLVPSSAIDSVVIAEGFVRFATRYYLAVLPADKADPVTVLFPVPNPPLPPKQLTPCCRLAAPR